MSLQITQKGCNHDGARYQSDADARVEGLRRVREQSTLFKNSKRKCYQAKEVIYRESEDVDRICIIRSDASHRRHQKNG